jgi:hypothetical protein
MKARWWLGAAIVTAGLASGCAGAIAPAGTYVSDTLPPAPESYPTPIHVSAPTPVSTEQEQWNANMRKTARVISDDCSALLRGAKAEEQLAFSRVGDLFSSIANSADDQEFEQRLEGACTPTMSSAIDKTSTAMLKLSKWGSDSVEKPKYRKKRAVLEKVAAHYSAVGRFLAEFQPLCESWAEEKAQAERRRETTLTALRQNVYEEQMLDAQRAQAAALQEQNHMYCLTHSYGLARAFCP